MGLKMTGEYDYSSEAIIRRFVEGQQQRLVQGRVIYVKGRELRIYPDTTLIQLYNAIRNRDRFSGPNIGIELSDDSTINFYMGRIRSGEIGLSTEDDPENLVFYPKNEPIDNIYIQMEDDDIPLYHAISGRYK